MKKIALFLLAVATATGVSAQVDTLRIDKTYYPVRRAFYELTPVKKEV